MLTSTSPSSSSIIVGDGASQPVQCTSSAVVPTSSSPLRLNDVLACPSLIKNLLSIRKLTRDNNVSVEFDPLGFSIKDLRTKELLLRSDIGGDLYPLSVFTTASSRPPCIRRLVARMTWTPGTTCTLTHFIFI